MSAEQTSVPSWNPWKLATFGILVVLATALITGVVVANYLGNQRTTASSAPENNQVASVPQGELANAPENAPNPPQGQAPNPSENQAPKPPPNWAPSAPRGDAAGAAAEPQGGQHSARPHHVAARPSTADIDVCNRYASSAHDRTTETLQNGLVGGVLGAGLGAATGAIAGGGRGAGKGAGIGGLVGAAAGSLYGLNEANQRDARAAAAYRTCMRKRGYVD